MYAKWLEDFTVTFNEGAHGSITTQRVFTLPDGSTFPTPPGVTADSGYTFDGWPNMPATVTEDKTYTAQYTPVEYDITYELNGGSVSGTNPVTYNVTTPDITLINPTKAGYTFEGWTGTGLSVPTMTVVIPQGSTGDRATQQRGPTR